MSQSPKELNDIRNTVIKAASIMPALLNNLLDVIHQLLPGSPKIGNDTMASIQSRLDEQLKQSYESNALRKQGPAEDNQYSPPRPKF